MAQSYTLSHDHPAKEQPTLRFDWLRAAVASGFIATFAMTICMTVAYAVANGIGSETGNAFQRQLAALSTNELTQTVGDTFAVGMILNLAMGLIWAMVYARWFEPRLHGPGWRKGVVFSLLPFALSVLVFFPIGGIGLLGMDADAGFLPVLGNLILHLTFGFVLGSLYAIDSWSGANTLSEMEANSNGERGAAYGVVIGGIVGVIAGFAAGPAFEDLAGGPVIALAGALTGAAIGMLIGSLLGLRINDSAP